MNRDYEKCIQNYSRTVTGLCKEEVIFFFPVRVWEYWLCYWAKTESSEQANMNFQIPWKLGNFLPSWERLSYLRWTLLRDVGCVSISLVFIKANSFWTHCKAIHGSWHFRCGHVKLTSQPERCCVAELKDCDGSLWWLHVNITSSWAKYPPFRPNKILDKKPVDFWMSWSKPHVSSPNCWFAMSVGVKLYFVTHYFKLPS